MSRLLAVITVVFALIGGVSWLVPSASAQSLSGLARVDPSLSGASLQRGALTLTLTLSQPVPYRVYTLDEPRRLVLDFREVDWAGVS